MKQSGRLFFILAVMAVNGLIGAEPLLTVKFTPAGVAVTPAEFQSGVTVNQVTPTGKFNGENSVVRLNLSRLPDWRPELGLTVTVHFRTNDALRDQTLIDWRPGFRMDLLGGGFHGQLFPDERLPIGNISRQNVHNGVEYIGFLRFRLKSAAGNGAVNCGLIDARKGNLVGRSANWATGITTTKPFGREILIGMARHGNGFDGEISQIRVDSGFLPDSALFRGNADFRPPANEKSVVTTAPDQELAAQWGEWLATWQNSFPLAAWGYFHRYQGSEAEYRQYRDANLTMVMAPLKTAAVADRAGLRVLLGLWENDGKYVKLHQNPARLSEYIQAAQSLPRFAGWMLSDEPRTLKEFYSFRSTVEKLRQAVPQAIAMVDLLPYAFTMENSFAADLECFIDRNRIPLILTDCYVLLRQFTDQEKFYVNYELVRRLAQKKGIGFMGFALLVGHGPFRQAGAADVAWQVNSLLAYGAKGIFYYNYRIDDRGYRPAMIDALGHPTELYRIVRDINGRILRNARLLRSLESVGVYHQDLNPSQKPPLVRSYFNGAIGAIEKLTGDRLIVSEFRLPDEPETIYLMLVNKKHGIGAACDAPELRNEVGITLLPGWRAEILDWNAGTFASHAASPLLLDGGGIQLLRLKRSNRN